MKGTYGANNRRVVTINQIVNYITRNVNEPFNIRNSNFLLGQIQLGQLLNVDLINYIMNLGGHTYNYPTSLLNSP